MLDAACAGEVFTSPVPDQMLAATKLVDGGAGVLHVVKNYTGDVMNFEMAAELAEAETGARVVSVVTNDDVAVQDSTWTAGRRGVGATVLLEKIAGAAAEQGRSLDEVAEVARAVNADSRSMGLALTSCTLPAVGHPSFELGDDEMELGVGIHGEPGRERVPLAPAKDIAAMLLEPVLADLPFRSGDGVVCFVNGLGRHPVDRALRHVQRGGHDPRGPRRADRPVAGRLVHHLARHGRHVGHAAPGGRRPAVAVGCTRADAGAAMGDLTAMDDGATTAELQEWVRTFARSIEANKDLLTELDAAIGDADHGANMHRGLTAAVVALDEAGPLGPGALFKKVGMTLVSTVGGASGPLYGTFFLRLGGALDDTDPVGPDAFAAALRAGLDGRGGAGQGGGGRQDDVRRPRSGRRRPGCGARGRPCRGRRHCEGRRPRRTPDGTPRLRCWPARGGPATSASAASDTRTPARRSVALLVAAAADTLGSAPAVSTGVPGEGTTVR